jgi:hypothetical protein
MGAGWQASAVVASGARASTYACRALQEKHALADWLKITNRGWNFRPHTHLWQVLGQQAPSANAPRQERLPAGGCADAYRADDADARDDDAALRQRRWHAKRVRGRREGHVPVPGGPCERGARGSGGAHCEGRRARGPLSGRGCPSFQTIWMLRIPCQGAMAPLNRPHGTCGDPTDLGVM